MIYTEYEFIEQIGSNTTPQIKQTQKYINYPDTNKALNAGAYYSQNGGKIMSHSEAMRGDECAFLISHNQLVA